MKIRDCMLWMMVCVSIGLLFLAPPALVAMTGENAETHENDGGTVLNAMTADVIFDGYIVANKLNGSELPMNTSSEKPCWPLHLKDANVTGG
jgi:hypothetical protein